MSSRVAHLVGLDDDSFRVDQIADSLGEVCELVVGVSEYLVLGADRLVGIGQQRKGQILGLFEGEIVLRGIE